MKREIEAEAKAMVEGLAAELARAYLEKYLKLILDTYISAATGLRVGNIRRRFDPETNRHFVERFIGPAAIEQEYRAKQQKELEPPKSDESDDPKDPKKTIH